MAKNTRQLQIWRNTSRRHGTRKNNPNLSNNTKLHRRNKKRKNRIN